ncbi:hypothetical protein EV715DRAFT_271923 [Schizophyllum commune]
MPASTPQLATNPATRPTKRMRRTATAVLAGQFDPRPARDVLTSLLNGVPPYQVVEKEEENARRQEKKEAARDRKKARAAEKARKAAAREGNATAAADGLPNGRATAPFTFAMPTPAAPSGKQPNFHVRPAIHITSGHRSVSVTPPPMTPPPMFPSSPGSTPGPDDSSATSRTSSKRPYTPDTLDGFDRHPSFSAPVKRKKPRAAAKKGWKGWVEGSPEPSDRLINLDQAVVFQERRTRSGRNFDA